MTQTTVGRIEQLTIGGRNTNSPSELERWLALLASLPEPKPDPRDVEIGRLRQALMLITTCDPSEDAAWCIGIAESTLRENAA